VRWRGHNPWDLAVNLRGLALTIRTGNGYDANGNFADPVEYQVHADSVSLDAKLTALRIPHVFEDYGAGTHSWPYWQADLRKTLPWLMATFAAPPIAPAHVTFTAIEPSYAIYGWRVAVDRRVLEFSRLAGAGRDGFALSGSGRATVTTPARYAAGRRYEVVVRGPAPARRSVLADARGRLHIAVGLGASNTVQQDSPQSQAAPTIVRTARVTIAAG
jgi:hypothetical protein